MYIQYLCNTIPFGKLVRDAVHQLLTMRARICYQAAHSHICSLLYSHFSNVIIYRQRHRNAAVNFAVAICHLALIISNVAERKTRSRQSLEKTKTPTTNKWATGKCSLLCRFIVFWSLHGPYKMATSIGNRIASSGMLLAVCLSCLY